MLCRRDEAPGDGVVNRSNHVVRIPLVRRTAAGAGPHISATGERLIEEVPGLIAVEREAGHVGRGTAVVLELPVISGSAHILLVVHHAIAVPVVLVIPGGAVHAVHDKAVGTGRTAVNGLPCVRGMVAVGIHGGRVQAAALEERVGDLAGIFVHDGRDV